MVKKSYADYKREFLALQKSLHQELALFKKMKRATTETEKQEYSRQMDTPIEESIRLLEESESWLLRV